jgi:hypothetical protein
VGLFDDQRGVGFQSREQRYVRNLRTLDETLVRSSSGDGVSATQLLRRPEVHLEQMLANGQVPLDVDSTNAAVDIASAETAVKYASTCDARSARSNAGDATSGGASGRLLSTACPVCGAVQV